MEKIVLYIAILFSFNLNAKECTKVEIKKENYLSGSTITVKLKSGEEYTFSGDKYKVVERISTRLVCKEEAQKLKRLRNTLYGVVGNGPSDSLSTKREGNRVTVKSEDENYLGIGYNRDVLDIGKGASLNIGVQVDSSESAGATIGVSW